MTPSRWSKLCLPFWVLSKPLTRRLWGKLHPTSHEQCFTCIWKRRDRALPDLTALGLGARHVGAPLRWCDGGCAAAQPSWGMRWDVNTWGQVVVDTALHWEMANDRQVGLSKSDEDHLPGLIMRTFYISRHLQRSSQTTFQIGLLFYSGLFCWDVQSSSQVQPWSLKKWCIIIPPSFWPGGLVSLSTAAFYPLRGWKVLLFLQVALDVWEVSHVHITTLG